YTQSGINAAARIVEVVSGMTFDAFLQKRLFDPLGMKHTTFYLTPESRSQLVTAYAKNKETGLLEPVPPRPEFGPRDRPPQGNCGPGGAWGTQAWIDPVKGVAYVLMVQRSNFPNSDASDVRRNFQRAAADALAKQ